MKLNFIPSLPLIPAILILAILGCSASTRGKKDFVNKQTVEKNNRDTSTRYPCKFSFSLGSKICFLNCSKSATEKAVFLSIHDDENTAVEAFNAIVNDCPDFTLMELNQNGDRLIRYGYNGNTYSIDPNRIFSKIGLLNSLKKYNATFPEQVKNGFSNFADEMLDKILPKSKTTYIIAAHNNGENNLSINTYKGSPEANEVYSNPSMDIDDFIYVTDQADFEYFRSKKYNVVLQANSIPDDGSLSVYCQKNNVPYINIEAQDGHLEIQKKMIIDVYNLIKTKNQ